MGVARILIGGNLKSEAVCTVLVGLLKLQYSQSVSTYDKAESATFYNYLLFMNNKSPAKVTIIISSLCRTLALEEIEKMSV